MNTEKIEEKNVERSKVDTLKNAIAEICGTIDWDQEDATKGYFPCPGSHMHSGDKPDGGKDCCVYVNGAVTISCFHQKCFDIVQEANKQLRYYLKRDHDWESVKMTPEQRVKYAQKSDLMLEAERLGKNLDYIQTEYPWSVSKIIEDSAPITNPWLQYLGLWNDEDILWCGDRYHSGELKHRQNFLPVREWKKTIAAPYQFISHSSFVEDCYRRQSDQVASRKFFVVECDELHADPAINKDMSGAVLRWIREKRGWDLKCVIDSGNKSIHGHFEFKAEEEEWAKICLRGLKCDVATLRDSQPVRSPGFMRDNGREQRLLWIQ